MASTITHTQQRNIIAGTAPYQVIDTVTAATGIDKNVFTYDVSSSTFNHVSTVLDMVTYLDTHAAAVTAGHPFYRQLTVTKNHASVTEAQAFANMLIARMTSLAREYDIVTTEFTAGSPQTETLPLP